jgi:hypothetical protein
MRLKKYAAAIHSTATVTHATVELLSAHELSAPLTFEGTMSLVWLIAECIRTARSRLPRVLPMSQARATDRATTWRK